MMLINKNREFKFVPLLRSKLESFKVQQDQMSTISMMVLNFGQMINLQTSCR